MLSSDTSIRSGEQQGLGSGDPGGVPRGGSHPRGGQQEGGGSPGDLMSSQATSRCSLIILPNFTARELMTAAMTARMPDGAWGICVVVRGPQGSCAQPSRGCSRAGTACETHVPAAATSVLGTVACGPKAAPELGPAGVAPLCPCGSADSFSSATGPWVTQWELGWGPRPPTGHQPFWGAEPGPPAPRGHRPPA